MVPSIVRLKVGNEREVTAILHNPGDSPSGCVFIYAPGASSDINDPFGSYACALLAERGYTTVQFQFPYTEEGRRAPDRPPILEATWLSAIAAFRQEGCTLVVGGRSMGGRIASKVAADGACVDGLALFAYPLHSPRLPSEWRDKHLASIQMPILFCSGTRDPFASPGELRQVALRTKKATIHFLEGADHGFSVRKSSGRTRQDVWAEATTALLAWMKSVYG